MGYSIVDFAKSLRSEDCRIRNTPNLIFLCGGKTTQTGEFLSARDYFYRHLKSNAAAIAERVKLAEDVNAWFPQSPFEDLLELENFLADFADITVLFVESPGSIAELGAFAASDALRPKTLAVLNRFYGSDRNFITDGPVKKIKNENEQLVYYYDWDPEQLNSPATETEFGEMAGDLTALLVNRDESQPVEQGFDKGKHGHALLMVSDLIEVAGVATRTEIADCLRELGWEPLKHLSRYLSLLESMSFIERVLRSNQSFYVSRWPEPFIRYAYKPSAPLKDLTRIKLVIRDGLDRRRKSILAKYLDKPPNRGPHDV